MKTKESWHDTVGYLNAGGRGTRLIGAFEPSPDKGIAKALLEIGTPPIKLIDHHIANLRQQEINHIVVAAGDQDEVYEYVSDCYGKEHDVFATQSDKQQGTGGDLISYARSSDSKSDILVQNIDTILDIDLKLFYQRFQAQKKLGGVATIALTRSRGVPNEGAYLVGTDERVIRSLTNSANYLTQKVAKRKPPITQAVRAQQC